MKKFILLAVLFLFLAIPTVPSTAVGIGVSREPIGAFKITAYHGSQVKGRKQAVTASGKIAAAGRTIAVDPRVIPMGTVVEIEGIGTRIAEDTGKDIKGKWIDLYATSLHEARKFGVKRKQVYIVKGG
jgi:3D (Asp-Asp-Asp) domain-containing protein